MYGSLGGAVYDTVIQTLHTSCRNKRYETAYKI